VIWTALYNSFRLTIDDLKLPDELQAKKLLVSLQHFQSYFLQQQSSLMLIDHK
jgi:hypothetical protein